MVQKKPTVWALFKIHKW